MRTLDEVVDIASQAWTLRISDRVLVAQRFAWPHIAQHLLAVYRWALGQGDKPDCVM